jgi:hypothetical protein
MSKNLFKVSKWTEFENCFPLLMDEKEGEFRSFDVEGGTFFKSSVKSRKPHFTLWVRGCCGSYLLPLRMKIDGKMVTKKTFESLEELLVFFEASKSPAKNNSKLVWNYKYFELRYFIKSEHFGAESGWITDRSKKYVDLIDNL